MFCCCFFFPEKHIQIYFALFKHIHKKSMHGLAWVVAWPTWDERCCVRSCCDCVAIVLWDDDEVILCAMFAWCGWPWWWWWWLFCRRWYMLLWLFKLFNVRKTLWQRLQTALFNGCRCCCSLWRFNVSLVLSSLPHTSHRWHAVNGKGSDRRPVPLFPDKPPPPLQLTIDDGLTATPPMYAKGKVRDKSDL